MLNSFYMVSVDRRPHTYVAIPVVPANFMPPDAVTREMGNVQEKFADSLGGVAEYHPSTARWTIIIGEKQRPDKLNPTFSLYPHANYQDTPETFELTATYMSADGALVKDMEHVEKIDAFSGGLRIFYTRDGHRVVTIISQDRDPLNVSSLSLVK